MSATANILHQPTCNHFYNRFSKLKSLKYSLFLRCSSRKSVFCCGSITRTRTMTEMIKTSAFRSGRSSSSDAEDGVGVIEQEALIDGSPKLVASGLETTLNRLVCIFSM